MAHSSRRMTSPLHDRAALKKARRVVVKVGTSLLTGGGLHVNRPYLRALASALGELWNQGREVALVTSGAIGAGAGQLGFETRPQSVPERQACAAAGQVALMHYYAEAFRKQTPPRAVGQLLLTRDGLEDRTRYLNARHTLEALFERGAVPIINENDTVSVDEIKFGDNDRLSALVAVAAEAQALVLLTDVPGLLDAPPRENPDAKLISCVPEVTARIEALAAPTGSFLGTGGMVTKLQAAKIVTAAGEAMVLVGGHDPRVLLEVFDGREVGTYFPPRGDRLVARKRWLAFSARSQGTIRVDAGAREALVKRHKSLLPSGIVSVEGRFGSGALVELAGPDGHAFARGLANYTAAEIDAIRGLKTQKIAQVLGQLLFEEVVHRDNLVVL